jgi:hypothetical protein
MSTELPALWTGAGANEHGQLGIAAADGSVPNLGTAVDNFTALNNGELPDAEFFTDVSKELSGLTVTVLLGSDGHSYATGQLDNRQKWLGIDSALLSSIPRVDTGDPNTNPYGRNVRQPRQAELVGDFYEVEAAETSTPSTLDEGWELRADGTLWLKYGTELAETPGWRQIMDGVTDAGADWDAWGIKTIWTLKEMKLWKFDLKYADKEHDNIQPRKLAGSKRFKRLWVSRDGYDWNRFLIDDNDVLWVAGTNEQGQLGVPVGSVLWTRYATSSKVAEVVPLGNRTFIKRKD